MMYIFFKENAGDIFVRIIFILSAKFLMVICIEEHGSGLVGEGI